MKKVHTEIYMGKTIEVFRDCGFFDYRCFFVKIDGNILVPRGGGVSSGKYIDVQKAVTSAKLSIKKNMNKADEIANIEKEIARLQAILAELKG